MAPITATSAAAYSGQQLLFNEELFAALSTPLLQDINLDFDFGSTDVDLDRFLKFETMMHSAFDFEAFMKEQGQTSHNDQPSLAHRLIAASTEDSFNDVIRGVYLRAHANVLQWKRLGETF